MLDLAIILTVHNRREITIECLESIAKQELENWNVKSSIYLTDDGSTDGTADSIRERYPRVKILYGSGNLYWNGGMCLAFGEAIKDNRDFYLWLNNDTALFRDALARLLNVSRQFQDKAIIVGSTKDPDTNQWSYGGAIIKEKFRPLKFTPVMPEEFPKSIDTMNGNCVLIPRAVTNILGNLDSAFTHGIGDRDYGLRARKKGIPIYLGPGYYGYCKRNPPIQYPKSIIGYLSKMSSIKVLPFKEYVKYAKRHAGPFWPLYAVSPYVRAIIGLILRR